MNPIENQELNRLAINYVLDQLSPFHRELLQLRVSFRRPSSYTGSWPATTADVAHYIGMKFRNKPLSRNTLFRETQTAFNLARAIASGAPNPNSLYHKLYPQYSNWISQQADKLSRGDADLADDLQQQGLIALWDFTQHPLPESVQSVPAYICGRIRFSMYRLLRKNSR